MRILIADDDRMTTMMLESTLAKWGYEVIVAHDGSDAWKAIVSDEPPALAIIDWVMPGIDGIELCRRVRRGPLRNPIYMILLTSRSARQDLVAGLKAGADDYLTKPFDPDELQARIHVGRRTLDLITNVKRLSGLLPICCYCKSIRSDKDYWEQVDRYLAEHTDLKLTHGICPKCLPKVLAELDDHATRLER